jgi:signal transduction histidine kinase
MVVSAAGDLSCNEALSSLLRLPAPNADRLHERFQVARFGGPDVPDEDLPWRRAARAERFSEIQVWFDRERVEKLLLHVRGQTWGGQGVVAIDDVAEHPFVLQQATLAGSIATALLEAAEGRRAEPSMVEDVARALGAEAVFLLGASPAERQLRLLASLGLPADVVLDHQTVSFDLPSILATAARTQTLQSADHLDDLASDQPGMKKLRALGLQSMVALPLLAGGDVLGVLGLAWRARGRVTRLEQRTLSAVSAACALGLLHARSRGAERREVERLRSLRDAAVGIELGLPLRQLLRRLVEQACELTHARYGALGVLDQQGSGLADFITVGVPDDVARRIGHLPEGHGLLGKAIREHRTIRSADLRREPDAVGFPPEHPRMTTFLGTPLRVGQAIYGNFYLCDKEGGAAFDVDDEQMLELFAAQSALVVGHARQQEMTRQSERERERLRDDFAATVAHDIRSPIATILLFADRLLAGEDGQEQVSVPVSTLQRIQRSGRRVARLSRDLLDVSRMDIGRVPLDRQVLAVGAVVAAAVAEAAPALEEHTVDVLIQQDVPEVWADPARLEQVLMNLLENAAKYSPAGAPIRVVAESAAQGAVITIEDRGPGIASEDLPRLFDRFYQAPDVAGAKGGLGLGLYIARALVEAHGGRLWVDSTPGQGSRFHIWVPQAAPQPRKYPEQEAPSR